MISKIVKFINLRKKTIFEKTIPETIDILQNINKTNLNILNEETLEILEEIKGKLKHLNNINYKNESLNSLNGVLVELIRKHLDGSKKTKKLEINLYTSLINYKNHVDKIILDLEQKF